MQTDGIGTSYGVIIGIVLPLDSDDQGSFQLKKGEVVAIQGPNGASKSTTLRILGAPAIQELDFSDGLSGGQQQKVAIGRAIPVNPDITPQNIGGIGVPIGTPPQGQEMDQLKDASSTAIYETKLKD